MGQPRPHQLLGTNAVPLQVCQGLLPLSDRRPFHCDSLQASLERAVETSRIVAAMGTCRQGTAGQTQACTRDLLPLRHLLQPGKEGGTVRCRPARQPSPISQRVAAEEQRLVRQCAPGIGIKDDIHQWVERLQGGRFGDMQACCGGMLTRALAQNADPLSAGKSQHITSALPIPFMDGRFSACGQKPTRALKHATAPTLSPSLNS